jgi:hypothetical protein
MNLGIVGSRDFNDYEKLKKEILTLYKIDNIKCIVSGGASGADKLGERFAEEFKLEKRIFYPDWNKYGKRAGFIRNKDIVENSDKLIAFWDSKSKGTKLTIDLAKEKSKAFDVLAKLVP